MQTSRETILQHIQSVPLPAFLQGHELQAPAYNGFSIANLPASICRWLGIPPMTGAPLSENIESCASGPFRNVILLLVDGLGFQFFEQFRRQTFPQSAFWAQPPAGATIVPLTSIVPSTTAAALTTLWTGQMPAQHGVIGYEMWLKEYGVLANMINHSPASFRGEASLLRRAGFIPETFLPVPTLGPHLLRNGVQGHALQHISIARSGLSSMLFSGVNVQPFRSAGDLFVSLRELLQERAAERKYIYAYWGGFDELSHHNGPRDERVLLEWDDYSRHFQRFLETIPPADRTSTLVLLCADHGQIATPPRPELELARHPELMKLLSMNPSGENRLPYLFLRSGCREQVEEIIHTTWPGKFLVSERNSFINSSLFGVGKPSACLADRVGDLVVIPTGDNYWWWANRENDMLGRHGGLTPQEMLVPLVMLPL